METSRVRWPNPRGERRFFSAMAIVVLLVATLGFSRTYFLRPVLPTPTPALPGLTPLIHLHAALFTAWVLLLVLQARLVAGGRVMLHRRAGVAGAVLAGAMVVVGVLTALHGALRGVAPFGMEPLQFLVVPLVAVALFAGFVVAAILARRDAARHKRLMLLATIALLPPAVARWALLLGVGPPVVLAVSVLLVLPIAWWDFSTTGRIHPVTLWGGLLLLVSGPLRLAVAGTDGWLALAARLASLVR